MGGSLKRSYGMAAVAAILLASAFPAPSHAQERAADLILRNGAIYTADAADRIVEAVAIRDGRIVYVGSNTGVGAFEGPDTRIVDVKGRMVMPGLVDSHMHPIFGGQLLRQCNLNYAPLTERQFLEQIQACLDAEPDAPADKLLTVGGWYRQYMQPAGTEVDRTTLDRLRTRRPILVLNRDGHSKLANSRALELAGVADGTPNPPGGSIIRNTKGQATGILEDAAGDLVSPLNSEQEENAAVLNLQAALKTMAEAGVTTFLDAAASPDSIAAYETVRGSGAMTARAHVAVVVEASGAETPSDLVAQIAALRDRYDHPQIGPAPDVRMHTAKLFMDGVIQAPAQTAGLVDPYWVADPHGQWVPGTHKGPIYIEPAKLTETVVGLVQAGIDPHIHAIGDRAVKVALDALTAGREAAAGKDIRPAIAHAELVEPADYARFAKLKVAPVMSYQWSIPGPNSVTGAKNYLGPDRFERMEPFDKLAAAGVPVVYGSDWPVDRMNYWLALKAGITRAGSKAIPAEFAGRLNHAPGLSRIAALRSITINGATSLHQDKDTGSIETGKLADIIVLQNNFLQVPEDDLDDNKVLLTLVGGRVVYDGGIKVP